MGLWVLYALKQVTLVEVLEYPLASTVRQQFEGKRAAFQAGGKATEEVRGMLAD